MTASNLQNRSSTLPLGSTLLGGHGLAVLSELAPAPATPVGIGTLWTEPAPLQLDHDEHEPAAPDKVATTGRTTVLPRRAPGAKAPAFEMRPRFHRLKTLGEGAMGRVELVRDNDIRRTVAVKHLLAGTESVAALSRFADEIRVVGQLEHPGIVPIYDVDRGDDGQLYLVMKHLQGETLEQVLERLRAGDAAYQERFTLEQRIRIFSGVLDAMSYAHARGVLHRDLKPANIMIGPYGEVTVLDWGIAKPLRRDSSPSTPDPHARTLVESHDARLLETQAGTLAGTPLYMSPEQAAGHNDSLDERSDVYALSVLLYEWLTLRHPLQDRQSVQEVLATLILNDYTQQQLFEPAQSAGVPMEYAWICWRGLRRDRAHRYQSVKELEAAIDAVHDGHIAVQCHITWTKSYLQRLVHWIDRHPKLYTMLFHGARAALAAALAGTVVFVAWRVLAAL
jgi:eukaryotic-like serine/threonine-protein kinase